MPIGSRRYRRPMRPRSARRRAAWAWMGCCASRADVLSGILNGIDTDVWDPARDPHPRRDASMSTDWRYGRRTSVRCRHGSACDADPSRPLFGVISRLTAQKGIDLLLASLPRLLAGGGQLVVLGSGEASYEAGLRAAAAANPQSVGVHFGYDESIGASDPGRLRRAAGAVAFRAVRPDAALRHALWRAAGRRACRRAVRHGDRRQRDGAGQRLGTGFHFAPVQAEMLAAAILRVLCGVAAAGLWRRLQRNAMQTDVSWRRPAAQYAALYRELSRATTPHTVIARSEATKQSR